MVSARHYWTDAQLRQDARYNRAKADEWKRRAHTEWDGSRALVWANACEQRAIASETILRARETFERARPK